MYTIYKITSHPTIDYAAEELKKYLRMMMPRCGEISISYYPDAADGFRLGLMQDFGLDTSDSDDVSLDDIVFLNTDANGGIIAGSNPGALLLAVYRYLRFCGCRWLFPGIDGEWVPVIDAPPAVNYRKMADHRYRGQCNEGAEYQPNMMESIEYTPKIGMNTYMIEFDNPHVYYRCYYDHDNNPFREKEPVSYETVLQWKRQCEVELQKRGLHFHDMGHGWTAEPFGIESTGGWRSVEKDGEKSPVPEEVLPYLAQLNGKRQLYHGVPLNTNICFSNPKARDIIAKYVADYAENQNNVDFLHIWLADATQNHCECEECRKKIVPDWYVMLLNEIDAELTRRNLNTHLVFIVYTDTLWAPKENVLNNPKRFTMLFAPISRLYNADETYAADADASQLTEFTLNANKYPQGMSSCLAFLHDWQNMWKGDSFCYEYHFWLHQYFDPSGMHIARLIYDDIRGLRKHQLGGIVEDGSQRSFFPTGFAYYVYGETLFDASVSYEQLKEDYFSHAFGEKWREVVDYLERLSSCFDFAFMSGKQSADPEKGKVYDPAQAEKLAKVAGIVKEFAPVIAEQKNQPRRASTVSWQLLDLHRTFITYIADIAAKKCLGDNDGAEELERKLHKELGAKEIYVERYYDQYMFSAAYHWSGMFRVQSDAYRD